jgi:hypothetical protein
MNQFDAEQLVVELDKEKRRAAGEVFMEDDDGAVSPAHNQSGASFSECVRVLIALVEVEGKQSNVVEADVDVIMAEDGRVTTPMTTDEPVLEGLIVVCVCVDGLIF